VNYHEFPDMEHIDKTLLGDFISKSVLKHLRRSVDHWPVKEQAHTHVKKYLMAETVIDLRGMLYFFRAKHAIWFHDVAFTNESNSQNAWFTIHVKLAFYGQTVSGSVTQKFDICRWFGSWKVADHEI